MARDTPRWSCVVVQRLKIAGLGLSLLRAFAERHGGTLELERALGKGTPATILLPLESAVAPASRNDPEPAPRGRGRGHRLTA